MAKNSFNLFYTLKLDVSKIIADDKYVGIRFSEAKEKGYMVSLGDNQIFEFIRNIQNVNYGELLENIRKLTIKKNNIKKLEKSKENSRNIGIIQNKINELMFIPHIISVKCDTDHSTKKQYKDICSTGFRVKSEVNGKVYDFNYKRLCAGAGQLRRNTSIFVNSDLYDELEKIMMCGLNKKKIGKINLAKFSAYYALYSSATNKVTTPRVCVIDDFKHTLNNEKISWIFDNENGEKDIKVCEMDVEINSFDGSGIVCPEFANVWKSDLKLDYTPSSFILRSAWIKGLVSVFDFKEFADKVANKSYIIDVWGNKQYVKDIDVILTASQFKMWKKYSSWEEYCGYHSKFKHVFGIARVNKKTDNIYTTMNYQYVQSNSFTEESICKLSDYTLDWIKKVMSGDELYTSLFMIGLQDDEINVNKVENELGTYIAKALMYNRDILNDKYIRMKINQTIQKKTDQLKIGKCLVEGSYEFAIPDLYAMAEHAFGMDVVGLLNRKQCWSKRWADKGSSIVAIMRSPLVAPAENQLTNIYTNDTCSYWFKHISSGLITNIWDTTMNRCSDADYDGDLLLTSDNKYLIDAVDDDQYPIMYEKSVTKEQNIGAVSGFANMDVKSFDSKIGFITNLASSFIAMLYSYNKNSDEYKEIRKRIDLLRYYQGIAIDATKGDVFVPPPRKWSHKQRMSEIPDDAGEDEVNSIILKNERIHFENRICANKKPYFFIYVYPHLHNKYDEYRSKNKKYCRMIFGKPLSDVLYNKDKTKKERYFTSNYYKYMPVLRNNCAMNILTKHIESEENKIKWELGNENFDSSIFKSDIGYDLTNNEMSRIKDLVGQYNKNYSFLSKGSNDEEFDDDICNLIVMLGEGLKSSCLDVCSNIEYVTNYIIDLSYGDFKNKDKTAMWSVFGDQVLENIKQKSSTIRVPIADGNGVEYLGKKYSLKEIEL